jgi:hypothetical protein
MNNISLSDENVILTVAREIVQSFVEQANSQTIDVDFKMKNGRMEILQVENQEMKNAIVDIHGELVPQPNTSFSFNTTADMLLDKIKISFCEKIENDSISDQEYSDIQLFIKNIIKTINSNEELLSKILDKLRNLHDLPQEHFPMFNSRLVLFEFGHKEDYGDMIKVANFSRYNKNLQAFVGEKRAVAKDLLLRRRDFGYRSMLSPKEIYAKIIDEQKAAKNPLYEDLLIDDVKIVREAKECHMDLFIDYSPISREEYEQLQINQEFRHGAD